MRGEEYRQAGRPLPPTIISSQLAPVRRTLPRRSQATNSQIGKMITSRRALV
jgi:hypothetical protein